MIFSATRRLVDSLHGFPNRRKGTLAQHPLHVVTGDAGYRPFLGWNDLNDAVGCHQPAPQHHRFGRLGQVVVGPRLQSCDHILFRIAAGEHDHVGKRQCVALLDLPADIDAVHPRHLPIEDHQSRGVVALQDLPRLLAVLGHDHLVAPLGCGLCKQVEVKRVVVSQENLHGLSP